MWRAPPQEPNFESIQIKYLENGTVAVVSFNRPKKANSMRYEDFDNLQTVFDYLGRVDSEVRAIVLTGNGKHFNAGLDIVSASAMNEHKAQPGDETNDPARASVRFGNIVSNLQATVSSVERCRVPVISALHGFVIGAGIDISAACDVRYTTKDARLTIKEVDIGLAADLGTIQRF